VSTVPLGSGEKDMPRSAHPSGFVGCLGGGLLALADEVIE
jgi:hypothetical protein